MKDDVIDKLVSDIFSELTANMDASMGCEVDVLRLFVCSFCEFHHRKKIGI